MGNREDLLAGAKRCLLDKGYAQTTAREIAAAAGVSLAAIGYHYGSKDALLTAALMQALDEWGEELRVALAAGSRKHGTPAERFQAAWTAVLKSFAAHRQLWRIQFELLAQLERNPALQRMFAEANRGGRLALAELLGAATGEPLTEKQALTLGTFYQAMLGGIATQWLVDPDAALTGRDMLDAMRLLTPVIGK